MLPPILADEFEVSGSHTYISAGSYTVTVTITDTSGDTATTTSTATVSDETITPTAVPVTVQVNQPDASLPVAGFSDPANLPASAFTVTIDWGDGSTPSSGTVQQGPFAMPGCRKRVRRPTPTSTGVEQ